MPSITVLKEPDKIEQKIQQLEDLYHSPLASQQQQKNIKKTIINLRRGYRGECNSHYHLSQLQPKHNTFLISDLRLVIKNNDNRTDIAQIDHILINKYGFIALFETKSFSHGLKVDDKGRFFYKTYQGDYKAMPSPLKQSKRHETILIKTLKNIGYHGPINTHHFVLVDYKAELIKPKDKFWNVCRVDELEEAFQQEQNNNISLLDLPNTIKIITKALSTSSEHINNCIHKLTKHHQPITIDYAAKFGLKPASAYLTLSDIELKFGLNRKTVFKQLVHSGLITKGKYGWFATEQGKKEGLIMKKQGNTQTLYLPKTTIEKAF